ncbi:hypothetical protein [Paenibacillus sp. BIHB 4019]|uniref:hypothetical protein n=1 Tax=Paenibacillus sp. BIHB 4019 TaxID=1870819 RepID=UPI00267EAFA0
MQRFEVLLLLSNVGLLVLLFVLKKERRPASLFVASVISTIFMILHWTFEGPRLQLLLAYGITLLFLALSSYASFKQTALPHLTRFWRGTVYAAIAAMLALTAGLMYVFPVFKLPAPTGDFSAGTQTFHFIDANREEIFGGPEGGKRELIVQFWYPAQHASGTPAPFIADRALLKEEPLSKTVGFPSILMDYLKYIPSHSYLNAGLSNASPSYPVVI